MKIDMKQKTILFSLITMVFLINACVKDNFNFDKWDKEIDYNAGFAFPVLYGNIGFADVVEKYDKNAIMMVDEDGLVSIVYNKVVRSKDPHEIIYLPNQHTSRTIEGLNFNFAGFDSPGDSVSYSYTKHYEFDVFNDDAELTSISLKSGTLNISAQSNFYHTARLYLTFPSITKNGVPYSCIITFAYIGDVSNINIDFTGYTIDMTQTPQGFNEIPIDITATLYYSGYDDHSGDVDFSVDLNNMQYEYVRGYFGTNTLIYESGKIEITMFQSDEVTIEDYYFKDPKFKVLYNNSYGIPTSFYFTELLLNSSIDEQDYNITHYEGGLPMDSLNPYHVSYASTIWTTVTDSLKVSKENSNIAEIIDLKPQWVQFIAHAYTNPVGITHNNFITDESLLEADVLIELPLWGYLYNFRNLDTVEFKMTDAYDYDSWTPNTRVAARVFIRNGLPIEVFAKIMFVDGNYNLLDNLFLTEEEEIIKSAVVDGNGRVINFGEKAFTIELDKNRLEKIKNTKHVIFSGRGSSTEAANQDIVRIYDDYRILFDIGFEIDIDDTIYLDSIN